MSNEIVFSTAVQRARTVRAVYSILMSLDPKDVPNYRMACESLFPDDKDDRSTLDYLITSARDYNSPKGSYVTADYIHMAINNFCQKARNCERLMTLFG